MSNGSVVPSGFEVVAAVAAGTFENPSDAAVVAAAAAVVVEGHRKRASRVVIDKGSPIVAVAVAAVAVAVEAGAGDVHLLLPLEVVWTKHFEAGVAGFVLALALAWVADYVANVVVVVVVVAAAAGAFAAAAVVAVSRENFVSYIIYLGN